MSARPGLCGGHRADWCPYRDRHTPTISGATGVVLITVQRMRSHEEPSPPRPRISGRGGNGKWSFETQTYLISRPLCNCTNC